MARDSRLTAWFRRHPWIVVTLLLAATTLGNTILLRAEVNARTADTVRNTRALCAIRQDQARRIAVSRRFLRENPHGAGGISVTIIRQSIANATATYQALRFVQCPPSSDNPVTL